MTGPAMIKAMAIGAGLLAAPPVLADETWDTPYGLAIYEDEVDGQTILTVPTDTGTARVYIPGLAGNYDNRSTHWGYWIQAGVGPCDAAITGADGVRSSQWGRVVIAFDRPAFPTPWTALFGACFEDPHISVRGDLPR